MMTRLIKHPHYCTRIYPFVKLPPNNNGIVASMLKAKHIKLPKQNAEALPDEERDAYDKQADAAVREFQAFENVCIEEGEARIRLARQVIRDAILNKPEDALQHIAEMVSHMDCTKQICKMPYRKKQKLCTDIYCDLLAYIPKQYWFRHYVSLFREQKDVELSDEQERDLNYKIAYDLNGAEIWDIYTSRMRMYGVDVCFPFFSVDDKQHCASLNLRHRQLYAANKTDGEEWAKWTYSNYEYGIPCYLAKPHDTTHCDVTDCPYRKQIRAANRVAKKSAECREKS